MKPLTDDERFLIENYGRAILHLHRQFQSPRHRLTPILGAGVGKPLLFPGWNDLANNISNHEKLRNCVIGEMTDVHRSPTYRIQILYEHLKTRVRQEALANFGADILGDDLEARVEAEWQQLLRDALYPLEDAVAAEGAGGSAAAREGSGHRAHGHRLTAEEYAEATFEKHRYLEELVAIIRGCGVTITYNFDDVIERCIEGTTKADRTPQRDARRYDRGYETVTNAALPFRSEKAVIYHPNGFLPRDPLDRGANTIVLTERTFADQLMGVSAGHYAFLSDMLQRNTCLLLGLSLEDATLRHLLRQNAIVSPGHCHYFVRYVGDGDALDKTHQMAELMANFDTYNLVTLHLRDGQIKALLSLIAQDPGVLRHYFEQAGQSYRQTFFLTGVPGAGKTTSISYLTSFVTFDEWLESPPELLSQPPQLSGKGSDISTEQQEGIDGWVMRQMAEKNWLLLNEHCGVFVIDRSILDPISYVKEGIDEEFCRKAKALEGYIRPGHVKDVAVEGHVIFLVGDADEFARRLQVRPGEWTAEKLRDLEERLSLLYPRGKPGITYIDVKRRSVHKVVKEIARVIYLSNPYVPAKMEDILQAALGERLRSSDG